MGGMQCQPEMWLLSAIAVKPWCNQKNRPVSQNYSSCSHAYWTPAVCQELCNILLLIAMVARPISTWPQETWSIWKKTQRRRKRDSQFMVCWYSLRTNRRTCIILVDLGKSLSKGMLFILRSSCQKVTGKKMKFWRLSCLPGKGIHAGNVMYMRYVVEASDSENQGTGPGMTDGLMEEGNPYRQQPPCSPFTPYASQYL